MGADLVTRMFLDSKNFDKNIHNAAKEIGAFSAKVEKGRVSVQGFSESIGGKAAASASAFIGKLGALTGISYAFSDIVGKSMEFEKALSSLRSITGLSANEMDFFKKKSIELGATSTQTASQVVEAFSLIGSQQPELLKNKEALAEVTEQAIILAEASGMTVPEAAKALSGSINQMGESANVAGEYINILAAASQEGSADIQYLSKAIEKSGGAASSVGVKYNELVAAIETIAPKITEASEAGTNLRNIFLTLESSSDKNLKPSVVGLSAALDNLAAKNMNVTALTKMFGKESVTAAMALVGSTDEYKRYTEAITGTNTAVEQQRINNDNLAGSIDKVSSAWEGLVLTMNKSNGFLSTTLKGVAATLNQITNAVKSAEEESDERSKSKSEEMLSNVKTAYEANVSGGISKERSADLAMIEYDEAEAYKIDKLRSDIGSLTIMLEGLEAKKKEINDSPYYSKQARIGVNQEIADVKKKIEVINEEGKARVLADSKIKDYLKSQYSTSGNKDENKSQIPDFEKLTEKQKGERILKFDLSVEKATDDIRSEMVKKLGEGISVPIKAEDKGVFTSRILLDTLKKSEDEIKRLTIRYNEETNKGVKTVYSERIRFIKKESEAARSALNDMSDAFMPQYIESEEMPDITGSIADYQKQIQDVTVAYNEETNVLLRGVYAKRIEDLQETLKEMTDVNNGMIDISKEIEDLVKNGIGVAFQSLGEALSAEDAGESMRIMLSGIMDTLKQFGSALVAAGAATIAFDKLFVNPYLAIIAGGALIVAASAAKSALSNTKGYANGGIIPGSSYAGDNLLARVNSGEMILNQAQQGNLFKLLNEGKGGPTGSFSQADVRFVVQGTDLVGVLNNFNKKQRRGR